MPRPNAIVKSLPYLMFANITISLTEKAIRFFADGQNRHHRLTDAEIAHLRAGGELHLTDTRGNVVVRARA
jgi:hypothetical protein